MKNMVLNKKGVALYTTAFMIIVALLMVAGGTAAFQTFTNFTAKYLSDTDTNYLCESGIERGLWLVKKGYGPAAGTPYTENFLIGATVTVVVTISLDAATGQYTVVASTGGKTITAKYQAEKITGWK